MEAVGGGEQWSWRRGEECMFDECRERRNTISIPCHGTTVLPCHGTISMSWYYLHPMSWYYLLLDILYSMYTVYTWGRCSEADVLYM